MVKIDVEKCKGCLFCIKVCPQGALEIAKSVNKRGLRYVIVKFPDKCTDCGLCAVVCPDCAITIESGGKKGDCPKL